MPSNNLSFSAFRRLADWLQRDRAGLRAAMELQGVIDDSAPDGTLSGGKKIHKTGSHFYQWIAQDPAKRSRKTAQAASWMVRQMTTHPEEPESERHGQRAALLTKWSLELSCSWQIPPRGFSVVPLEALCQAQAVTFDELPSVWHIGLSAIERMKDASGLPLFVASEWSVAGNPRMPQEQACRIAGTRVQAFFKSNLHRLPEGAAVENSATFQAAVELFFHGSDAARKAMAHHVFGPREVAAELFMCERVRRPDTVNGVGETAPKIEPKIEPLNHLDRVSILDWCAKQWTQRRDLESLGEWITALHDEISFTQAGRALWRDSCSHWRPSGLPADASLAERQVFFGSQFQHSHGGSTGASEGAKAFRALQKALLSAGSQAWGMDACLEAWPIAAATGEIGAQAEAWHLRKAVAAQSASAGSGPESALAIPKPTAPRRL